MVGALWTGISGLGGAQKGLDNESNNIANVNTIGYKASRVSFTDQMYQAKIGKGVTSFDVEKMFTQGNLKLTGVSYDVGLSGDGFFQVSNGSEDFYTRAGNFRMGESGTLEDVAKNKVQGWAVSEITDDDRISTDPNATKFTNAYSELLGNKIIRDSTTIETVIAKATDYNTTATSDSQTVYSGAGYKSASTKISDIELLVTEYNKLLTTHSNADPKPTASSSSVQKNYLNFNLNTVSMAQGDEMYVYVDGVKYTQSFENDEATTMKKFIDVLSNTPGFKAHYTDGIENNPSGTVTEGAYAYDNAMTNPKGGVYIEGLVPGTSFTITEFGWTDASNSNQATKGEVKTIQESVQGTGMGAIESIEKALSQAVTGKQQDVYSSDEISLNTTVAGKETFTVTINPAFLEKGGNTTITFDGNTTATLTADDTNLEAAAAIAAVTYTNWNTIDNGDGTVTFTAKVEGVVTDADASSFAWANTGDVGELNPDVSNVSISNQGAVSGELDNDFTYQINIYDKETKTNKTIPTAPLNLPDMQDIDAIVKAINTVADSTGKAANSELAYYVKAYNINGNLVVKTLDTNNDVEFTGELKGPIPEQQTIKLTGGVALKEHQNMPITGTVADGAVTIDFLDTTIPINTFNTGDDAELIIDWIIANKDTVMIDYNTKGGTIGDGTDEADDDNQDREIVDIIKTDAGNIEIVYKEGALGTGAGNVAEITASAASNGITQDASTQTVKGDLNLTFLGHNVANVADGDSLGSTVDKILSDKINIMNTWNSANPTKEIANILKVSTDEIKIIYKNTEADVSTIASTTDGGVTFDDSEELIKGELKGLIVRNINYSGREGAGAEFLQMTTTISQTSSKSDIQLRLDSLMMTDSAFGEYSVDETGMITMKQDGTEYAVGQIAVAKFTDNRGLNPVGDNLYEATNRSGTALFNTNNDKTADIKGGTLELSTADLSESLVNLMVFQKAFEANAKSITTADQILTTLIQLKR